MAQERTYRVRFKSMRAYTLDNETGGREESPRWEESRIGLGVWILEDPRSQDCRSSLGLGAAEPGAADAREIWAGRSPPHLRVPRPAAGCPVRRSVAPGPPAASGSRGRGRDSGSRSRVRSRKASACHPRGPRTCIGLRTARARDGLALRNGYGRRGSALNVLGAGGDSSPAQA